MFASFLGNKPKSRPDAIKSHNISCLPVSPSKNYRGHRHRPTATTATAGGFWPASVWNLLPLLKTTSTQKSSPKCYYKDVVVVAQDDEQQRHRLISPNENEDEEEEENLGPRAIEMDFLNQMNSGEEILGLPTPPTSPSPFILPRCLDQTQCYSPVKLVACPERRSKRIEFRADNVRDSGSLIEKFDKITITECARMADCRNNGNVRIAGVLFLLLLL